MRNNIIREVQTGGNMSSLHWTEFNTAVMVLRFAGGSSSQHNAVLVEGLQRAYERYIRAVANPQLNIRATTSKGCESLDDYVDGQGIAHVYMVDTGADLVQVQLLGIATSAMNSNLIEEVKTVYKKYTQPLIERQHKRKK